MSKRGKRKDEEEYSEGDAPVSKVAKKDTGDDSDSEDIFVCQISKNRRVSVRNWQGKVVVDIREFYVKDGKEMPGKKGVSLSMEQWSKLRDHAAEIDEAIGEREE
ncbi:RNA polymerase II transcriptional coactivator KIWI-like [Diospyros lotus]|uniref:RNA polymerase II transcriptional coactivator KIWI-like n=1 Tax=Diospyros lotus TaxID=55363 RepID=UPI002256BADA|nr:RNA polymerase II transcriptional coactivator KIWI-like [Diospyros lotus]